MTVIQRERVIPPKPAHTVTDTIYVASDGKEFRFRSDCERYEKRLMVESHPVFKSGISARTFYDDIYADLYFIRSEEDYQFFVHNIGTVYLSHESWQDGAGPGWYLFYMEDGGDYADTHYFYKLEEYEKYFRDMLDEWSSDIHERISDHELEVVTR